MALLTAFLTYLGKYILLICVAVAGFILGKKYRDKKTAK